MQRNKKLGLIVLIGVITLYLVSVSVLFDCQFFIAGVLTGVANIAIMVVVVGPFIWVANRERSHEDRKESNQLLGISAAIFMFYTMISYSSQYLNAYFQLEFNWVGKLVGFIAMLAIVATLPNLSFKEIGFQKPRKGVWKYIFSQLVAVFIIVLVGSIIMRLLGSQISAVQLTSDMSFETLFFFATTPGLDEEILFRGLLWVLIAQALPGKRQVGERKTDWNIIITTLLFGIVHGVAFDANLNIVFNLSMVILSGALGYLLAIVRNKYDSLFPTILLHNGVNLLAFTIPWLVQLVLR